MTQSILLRQIAYLKAENQILRSRLPGSIRTTAAERSLLVRLGAPLGDAIQELLSIVCYKTFLNGSGRRVPAPQVQGGGKQPGDPPFMRM